MCWLGNKLSLSSTDNCQSNIKTKPVPWGLSDWNAIQFEWIVNCVGSCPTSSTSLSISNLDFWSTESLIFGPHSWLQNTLSDKIICLSLRRMFYCANYIIWFLSQSFSFVAHFYVHILDTAIYSISVCCIELDFWSRLNYAQRWLENNFWDSMLFL